jgi:hypothetical protein
MFICSRWAKAWHSGSLAPSSPNSAYCSRISASVVFIIIAAEAAQHDMGWD